MGIVLGSQFDMSAALALDSRLQQADLTARDAIPSGIRYEGMPVYVISEETTYFLKGGITNSDWEEVGSGASGGGGMAPVLTVTADHTMDGLSNTIVIDATSGNVTVTLPAIGVTPGEQVFYFIRLDGTTNTVTIAADTGNTIQGDANYTLPYQWDRARMGSITTTIWGIVG